MNYVMVENIFDYIIMLKFIDDFVLKFVWVDVKCIFDFMCVIIIFMCCVVDFFENMVEVQGVILVSCGIDCMQYIFVMGLCEKNCIVFVGCLIVEKQVEVIFKVMMKFDLVFEIIFDIVGGGDQCKQLEYFVEQLGFGDCVMFYGCIFDEELWVLLFCVSLFVIVLIVELQLIVIMEVMVLVFLVVVVDVVVFLYFVYDGENGYLFELGNVDEFVVCLMDVFIVEFVEYEWMQQVLFDGVVIYDINCIFDIFEVLYCDELLFEQ